MAGEWITSAAFRADTRRTIEEFSRQRFRVENDVQPLLEGLLDRQSQKNILEESRKLPYEQRSQRDAITALHALLAEAQEIAVNQRRGSIAAVDVTLAYARKFCQFFPFC